MLNSRGCINHGAADRKNETAAKTKIQVQRQFPRVRQWTIVRAVDDGAHRKQCKSKEREHHNDFGVRHKPTAVTPVTATDTDESSVFTVTWELGHVNTHGCPTHLTTRRQLTLHRGGFHR